MRQVVIEGSELFIVGNQDVINEPVYGSYSRVTREESAKGLSLEAQQKEGRRFAVKNGWKYLKEFTEKEPVSAETLKRQMLDLLVDDVRKGFLKGVVCRDEDRLWRSFEVQLYILKLFKEYNVELFTFRGKVDFKTPQGEFVTNILTSISKMEVRTTARRIKLNKKVTAEKGLTHGPPAFGYESQASLCRKICERDNIPREEAMVKAIALIPYKNIHIINEDEAIIVREIFSCATHPEPEKRMGSRKIAVHLNKLGFRTRNNCKWTGNRILKILNNPIYMGKTYYDVDSFENYSEKKESNKSKQMRFEGKHEAIISEKMWLSAEKIRQQNAKDVRISKRTKHNYVLRGLIHCKNCGKTYAGKTYRKGVYYYICKNKQALGNSECSAPLIRKDIVEQKVWDFVIEVLESPKIIADVAKKLNEEPPIELKRKGYKKEIEKLESSVDLYYIKFENASDKQEQELCWKRLVELKKHHDELVKLQKEHESTTRPFRKVTVSDLKRYFSGVRSKFDNNPKNLRHLYKQLQEKNNLRVDVVDDQNVKVSLRIGLQGYSAPILGSSVSSCPRPYTQTYYVIERVLFIGREPNKYEQFKKENAGKHCCIICGKEIVILTRHIDRGIPKYCPKCRHLGGNHKWQMIRSQGYLLISDVAKKLGVTVKVAYRMTKEMPSEKIEGVKVFREEDVNGLMHEKIINGQRLLL